VTGLYRTEGVVLRGWKLGEADRILVFMTPDRGKVRGVAKGVRKTSSRFGGRLEASTHVAVQLYEGRGELHTVTQVEVLTRFTAMRDDLERYATGMTLLEAVDIVGQEGHPDPTLHSMLVGALGALERRAAPLLAPAFLLRVLAHEGLVGLDEDGLLAAEGLPPRGLSGPAADLVGRILGSELGAALNEDPSPATHEVTDVATKLFEVAVDRRLRSASLLDR
jgi:DNA repair protein RecO (recombination protein O)